MKRRLRIVTVGGGTGQYGLLSGLRSVPAQLTAIVTMMDSGGSSGRLRDEYGVLPPGDFTRCLIALSHHPDAMKQLLGHRFEGGSMRGHTVRNLVFTALQELTGDSAAVVERLHEIFAVDARVLPVTLDRADLVMHLENDQVFRGEAAIDGLGLLLPAPVLSVYLDPPARVFAPALEALRNADLVILGPGDLYTSVVPNLLVDGVTEAIAESSAKLLYVCNLMTKPNETPGYAVEDFVATIAMHLGRARLDSVLVNVTWPERLLPEYAAEGSDPVGFRDPDNARRSLYFTGDLAQQGRLVRHDPAKLAAAVVDLARRWFGKAGPFTESR
jgi:uncharacterized cofD-like protein